MAYDFDFHLASGEHNIEPEKEISVQFSLPEMKAEDSVSAYHLKDENSSAEKEDITADASAGTATLETQQFSIHALLVATANNSSGITIGYDEKTDIHSVIGEDDTKIILYCMNNSLHWPHKTEGIPNVPTYTETSFEKFFNANNITGETQTELKTKLENLLYAGYPYNGYGLYKIVNSVPTITEDYFNKLLTPPLYLRLDFPDSIGNNTFTYSDRTNQNKMALLSEFLMDVFSYNGQDKKTASGLDYTQLIQLPFYRAVLCMNYGDPIKAYSESFMANYYVTESQAYGGTRDAIWKLLKDYKLTDNGKDISITDLVNNLLKADTTNLIPTEKPKDEKVSISGDPTFYYSTGDNKWHTDRLSLKVPETYNTYFTLNLPDGVTEETGKTEVKGGESFSLVSSKKPQNSMSLSLSSTIPWMDPDLKVYVADSKVTAPDGKGFQNMIGAVIHQTDITKTVALSSTDTSLTFTKVWKDNGNKDNVRPDLETYKNKLHLMNGNTELTGFQPEIADKGDNSWSITYNGLPAKIDGKDAAFTVSEGSVDKYTADKESVKDDNETITNTYTPVTISGTKTWNNSGYNSVKKPDSITVNLLANGTVKDSKSVTADKNGQWEYSFDNLPKYDDNGQEIEYTITENNVTDYSTDYSKTINGYDITNTYTPGKTSVTVKKEWEDNNNQDGKRPTSVKVQLLANGENQGEAVDLSADNGWTYTWDNLDEKDKSSNNITYSVKEVDVPEGYTSQISDGSKQHYFVITNTHQPETTKIKVTKIWNDSGNQDGKRPNSVNVQLYADGKASGKPVTLTESNNWLYTWTGLPMYKNGGTKIAYTVKEVSDLPSGYTSSVTGSAEGG
ncbi:MULTISPECIES: Cna B-type domain-containing protein, partial [unclassified Bilifractor]